MSHKKGSPSTRGFASLQCSKLQVKLALGFFGLALGTILGAIDLGPSELNNIERSNVSDIASDRPSRGSHSITFGEPAAAAPAVSTSSLWQSKEIRGIYLSRFQVTGSTTEQTIRDRVRYFKAQGINTIIHGVWGNGCPMYNSDVMNEKFGMKSCQNAFQDDWLDWMIDEAHKQDMQVHAYFERGIKLDKESPIYKNAVDNGWFVPGVDKTYSGLDQYILDVNNPEVSDFFDEISAEFVQRYPKIDAVQWDDYLGYSSELPGGVNRTASLTRFVQQMRTSVKQANPNVSFDVSHHNPYWSGRYFNADWRNWQTDRAFIQVYNDKNFPDEIAIAEAYSGVAITENQLRHLDSLVRNPKIKSILIFSTSGNPERAAGLIKKYTAVQ
ncbi:MAG: family 10 glycosylhydrolase [Phormidesmis sp.]